MSEEKQKHIFVKNNLGSLSRYLAEQEDKKECLGFEKKQKRKRGGFK